MTSIDKIKPSRDFRDIVSILTVVCGVVFAFVVVQTTVQSHSTEISQLKINDERFTEKFEKAHEKMSDLEVKLTRVEGKIDQLLLTYQSSQSRRNN